MRYCFIVFLLVLNTHTFCQIANMGGVAGSPLKETKYVDVQGSPYLYDDWKNGAILDKSGNLSENIMIRYDGYRDEVQFVKDGKNLVVEPAVAKEFYFVLLNEASGNVARELFRNGYDIVGYNKNNYFNVKYDGTSKFLRKIKIAYMEEVVSNYGTNEQVKRFDRKEIDYVVINGVSLELSKSRKEVMDYFHQHKASMQSFIKQNKLKLKDDNDLIKILKKYDSLVEGS